MLMLGTVLEWNESENCYKGEKSIWVSPYKYLTFTKGTVEQSTEWFKEVKEQTPFNLNYCGDEIIGVTRLSDGVFFKIGMYVKMPNHDGLGSIYEFKYENDELIIEHTFSFLMNEAGYYDHLKHLRPCLFTKEDLKKDDKIIEYPKIIAFISNETHYICNLCDDNQYSYNGSANHFTLDQMLHDGKCVDSGAFQIYQVQNGSGEIFTIGDKVINVDNEIFIIDEFELLEKYGLVARSEEASEYVEYLKKNIN